MAMKAMKSATKTMATKAMKAIQAKTATKTRSTRTMKAKTAMKTMSTRAMKAKKAKTALKTMSKKAMQAMKAKKVGRKSLVFAGTRVKTTGGLKKQDLTMNKRGKVVSKKMHANGKKAFSHIKAWHVAVTKARQALGVNGFIAIGGKKPEGKALYAKAKAILEGK